MKRREFISLTGQAATLLAARNLLAAQPARVREAVVIGVDKAGSLPVLRGAASGAKSFDDWLRREGFGTQLLSDANGRVTVNDVYGAIADRVRKGTVDQLVVYFAGHGYISSYSEFWLLSEAPDNPNEAVSLKESIELAKVCGIPNVAFVSDACRSRPDSLGIVGLRGSLIFPNRTSGATRVGDVDVFLATLVGDPSVEVSVGISSNEYQGIFTEAFLDAFRKPDPPMILTVGGVRVVPNRRMKGFLEREVAKRLAAVSIQLRQVPDTQVVSEDNTYIGRVATAVPQPTGPPGPTATVQDVATADLQLFGIRGMSGDTRILGSGRTPAGSGPSPLEVDRVKAQTGYSAAASFLMRPLGAGELSDPSITMGVVVRGVGVRGVESGRRADARRVQPDGDVVVVPLATRASAEPDRSGRSVGIQFTDGAGTVVAALSGFWTIVTVDKAVVVDVSYMPAASDYRRSEYNAQRERIDSLRATVATAARFGVFRIEGGLASRTRTAAAFADRIRMMKGFDPTLGLYASYAYADAGLASQVASVRGIMRGDLGVDLFDVAMLANAFNGKQVVAPLALPLCPMLSQGWNYLRIKDIRLPPVFEYARDHLRQGLWTTFSPVGMSRVIESFRSTAG
jgi:hypothetical protein